MDNLQNLYNNLDVMITDPVERKKFESVYDLAIENDDLIFICSIMYAYGKTEGTRRQRERR